MSVQLMHGDCLELMQTIPDGSVDMVLCDLPYGTTSSKWDKVIPMEPLWEQYRRLLNGNGAVVLFGAEPFSSKLRLSNREWFKYDWIWVKNRPVGFVNAKLKPMNRHEAISVFSPGKTANCNPNNMTYHPQGLIRLEKPVKGRGRKSDKGRDNAYWRPSNNDGDYEQEYTNYPTTVIEFNSVDKAVHPTQKPVELLEYLILTYTSRGGDCARQHDGLGVYRSRRRQHGEELHRDREGRPLLRGGVREDIRCRGCRIAIGRKRHE